MLKIINEERNSIDDVYKILLKTGLYINAVDNIYLNIKMLFILNSVN